MAKAEKNLNWQEVDEAASITGDLKVAYDAYKAAQKVAADKRREFEEAFIAQARKKSVIDDGRSRLLVLNRASVLTRPRIEIPQRSKTLTDPCQSAMLPSWLGAADAIRSA